MFPSVNNQPQLFSSFLNLAPTMVATDMKDSPQRIHNLAEEFHSMNYCYWLMIHLALAG